MHPTGPDGAARTGWRTLWIASLVLGLAWLALTGTFLRNVRDTRFVVRTPSGFGWSHSCLTAYTVGADLARSDPAELYDSTRYRGSDRKTPVQEEIGTTLRIDEFAYPPAFLVVPLALQASLGSFHAVRFAWYLLSAAGLVLALAVLTRWAGGWRSRPALLAWPLILLAPTVHTALQIGNAHVLVLAAAVLGMLALEERAPLASHRAQDHQRALALRALLDVIGGALLGLAIVTKLWPAAFLVVLLVQRRFRALAWTLAGVAGWVLASIGAFGPEPWHAFFQVELPRLESGAAFGFIRGEWPAIVFNLSPQGVVHKLRALGLTHARPALVSTTLSIVWASLVVAAAAWIGWRERGPALGDAARTRRARRWLALAVLAQLQSPFLPWVYGTLAILWLLVLTAAAGAGRWLPLLFALFLLLSQDLPLAFLEHVEKAQLAAGLLALVVAVLLALSALPRPATELPRPG